MNIDNKLATEKQCLYAISLLSRCSDKTQQSIDLEQIKNYSKKQIGVLISNLLEESHLYEACEKYLFNLRKRGAAIENIDVRFSISGTKQIRSMEIESK